MTELRDINASTVLLGRFNPMIFSPDWLLNNGVIGPQEAQEAREEGIEVIAPNIASINLGSMKLVVEDQRFFLIVGDEPLIRAKDFPATCFNLLRHTPVHAVGINYTATLVGDSEEKWHRFGDVLAPKEPWADFLTDDEGKRLGGLRAMTVERRQTVDERWIYSRLSVDAQDSLAPLQATVNVNNHFALGNQQEPRSGGDAFKLINDLWDEAIEFSRLQADRVRSIADAA